MAPAPDLSSASDQEVVALALEGRDDGYHELVHRHRQRVHALIYDIVGTHEREDDLTQETFATVFQTLHRYRPELPFAPWIQRIARNTAVDYIRCRPFDAASAPRTVGSAYFDLSAIAAPTPIDTSTPDPEMRCFAAALPQGLRHLRPNVRRCFILRVVDGRSYAEIAGSCISPWGPWPPTSTVAVSN